MSDYRSRTIAVIDVHGDDWVVWYVTVRRLGNESRLSGAWTFPISDTSTWELLTFERTTWATLEAAQLADAGGLQRPLPLDAGAARQRVSDRLAEVSAAFAEHQSSRRTRLVEPPWPQIPAALDPEDLASQDKPRALEVARWFDDLLDCWDAIEDERTHGNRGYLHKLGGPIPLPFPVYQSPAAHEIAGN